MKIIIEDPSEYDLKGMLWSGAEKTLEEIIEAGMYDEFCQYIDDVYYEGIDLTDLNDILRFDSEQLKKDIGIFNLEDEVNMREIENFKKDCETYKKPRMITNSDMAQYSDLEDGEVTESELSEQIDEITDKLSEVLDAIDSVLDSDDEDDFESAKDDLRSACDELDDLLYDYMDSDSKVYDALYNKFADLFNN